MKLNTIEKAILIAVSAMAVGTCVAKADLGDTYKQSCARYGGKPQEIHNGRYTWIVDSDHTVTETCDAKGRCDSVEYNNFAGITPSEILTKISQNVPLGESFTEYPVAQGRYWETSSQSVTVSLSVFDNQGHGRNPFVLTVWSKAYSNKYIAALKAEQAQEAPTPVPANYN